MILSVRRVWNPIDNLGEGEGESCRKGPRGWRKGKGKQRKGDGRRREKKRWKRMIKEK